MGSPLFQSELLKSFSNLELLAKQQVEGFITGLHKSPFHGFSVEFAEHRLYNTGESTRHIDWKVYSKTDKLFVKRYEEETNLRCQILIDTSSSMYYPIEDAGKIRFSVFAAACLANLLQRQKDAVGLITFSDAIELQTPVKTSGAHLHQVITLLAQLLEKQPAPKSTRTSEVLHLIAQKIHRRSLLILFTDFLSDFTDQSALFSALQHLRHNLNEVIIFHVTDRATELNFEFEDRPYEFIDNETGERIRLQPSQIKSIYQERVYAHFQELKMKCNQFKIGYIEVDIADGVEPILQEYLTKRSKMR